MAMDQKAREAVEMVDSCRDRCGFRIGKQSTGEKRNMVGVSCLQDESGAMKGWMIKRKSGRSIWKG